MPLPRLLGRLWRGALVLLLALGLLGAGAFFARFELMRWSDGLPPFPDAAGEERSLRVAMRDSVELATTVYEPASPGPWPAVLIRNPYERFDLVAMQWCGLLVRYGYACVYQDVRGQGDSAGEWDPIVNEVKDGADTLAWLDRQPFQNGRLAMMGPSYLGAVQWAAAVDAPASLRTIVPAVITTRMREVLFQDGMFRHETFTAWSALMPARGMQTGTGPRYQQAIRHRPHLEADEAVFGRRLAWYREWIQSADEGAPLWQREENRRLIEQPARTGIPVLMIGGWYDVFFGPQMKDWQSLASRAQSRFVIGPWTHIGRPGDALEFPGAEGGFVQWPLVLDWFGHHLKGEPLVYGPGVATYAMGENRWVERPSWPPPTRPLRLHLASADRAASCAASAGESGSRGVLAATPPERSSEARYRYDPDDPVPTRGGAGMLAFILPGFDGAPAANAWQGSLCERADILSCESEPFSEALAIAGEIRVRLSVSSDAADTAFTAKLVQLLPDGRAVNIRDSITTLAYRNGAVNARDYTPGEVVEIELALWPIEWTVPSGARLRLDVSSSDFPKFHAHPNRAGPWALQAQASVAQQRLLLGPEYEGWLELPVLRVPTRIAASAAASQ